jgi:hypothetical protein
MLCMSVASCDTLCTAAGRLISLMNRPLLAYTSCPPSPVSVSPLGVPDYCLQGVEELLKRVSGMLQSTMVEVHVLIPYNQVRCLQG